MMQDQLRDNDGNCTVENGGDGDLDGSFDSSSVMSFEEVPEVGYTGIEGEIKQNVTSLSTPISNGRIGYGKEYVAIDRIEKSRQFNASRYVVHGKSNKNWGRKVNRNGYESYDCNFCGKNFVLNSLLAKHLQRVHSNQIGEETEEAEDEKLPDQVQVDKKTDYSSNDEELPTLFGPFPTQDDLMSTRNYDEEKETNQYESDLEESIQEESIASTGITEQLLDQPSIVENGISSNVEKVDEITNSCSFCPKTFKDEGILIKHLLSIHSTQTKKLNTCKVCKKIFVNNSQLLDHSKEHVSPTPRVKKQKQPLKQQPLLIIKEEPLPIHNKTNGIYQKRKSELESESNENNKTETEVKLPKTPISEHLLKDQFENEKVEDEVQLDEISAQVEEVNIQVEVSYSCSFCPRSFKDEEFLSRHLFSIHQTQTKKLICKFCKKFFLQSSHLVDHLKEHSSLTVKTQASPKPKPQFKVQQQSKFNKKESFPNYNKMNGVYQESNEEPEVISTFTSKVESNVNKIKPLTISLTRMSAEFIRDYETEIKIENAQEVEEVEEKEEEIIIEISHSCSFCPRSFKDEDLLLRHLFSIHQRQVKNLTCKVCKKIFGNNSLFLNHSKEHSSTPAVPVKQKIPKLKLKIQKKFKSESTTLLPPNFYKIDDENIQEKRNEYEIKKNYVEIANNSNDAEESLSLLEICEQFLKTETEVKSDCNVKDEETHSCSFCSRIFKKKENLDRHILSIHRPKPKVKKLKFKTCVYKMKIPKSQFLQHFLEEHTKKEESKINTQQQETTTTTTKASYPVFDEKIESFEKESELGGIENSENEQLLIQPTDIEIGSNVEVGEVVEIGEIEMLHKCPYCTRKFKERVNLKAHISSIHRPGRKVNYQHNCIICKKKFSHKSQLLDHSKEHSRVRQAQESRVKDSFPKSALELDGNNENDVSIKSEELFQPGEIEVGSNVELELGEILDIDETLHSCSFCTRTFKDKNTLEKHLLSIHQRQMKKQHTCKICKKVFIYHNQLTEHLRVHSPIKCKICRMRFSTKEDLNTHQNQEHSLSTIKVKELLETKEEKKRLKQEQKLKMKQLKMKYKQTLKLRDNGKDPRGRKNLDPAEKAMRHKYIPSSNKLKEPVVCTICSKSLWFKSNYERHLLRHEKKNEDASMFIKKKKYNKNKMIVNNLDQVVKLSSGELYTIKNEIRVELDRIDGPNKQKKKLDSYSSAASTSTSTNVSRRSSLSFAPTSRLTSHLTEIGINEAVDKLKAQILKHHKNQNHQLNSQNKKILFPKVKVLSNTSNKFKTKRSRNSESGGSLSVSNYSNSNYDSDNDYISYSDYDYDDENEFLQDDEDSNDSNDYYYEDGDDDEDMENHSDNSGSGDGNGKVKKVMEIEDYYDTGSPAYPTDYSSALFQVNSFLFAEEQKKKKNYSIIPFEMY